MSTTTLPTIEQAARLRTLRVQILLFPDVEILDFAGPYEVFSVASRIHQRTAAMSHAPFTIQAIAAKRAPVRARHGLGLLPDASFAEAEQPDILIVPGGVVDQPLNNDDTLTWLSRASQNAGMVASVCTGAFVLARIGLLAGQRVTTHWEDIPALRTAHPDLEVVESVPFVDMGRILTSAGISAGIDMSLHMVGRILGQGAAVATAKQMQYTWRVG